MSLGPYTSFIVTSYVLVTVVIIGLIVWIVIDYRNQRKKLRELESIGVKRRSAKQPAKRSSKFAGKSR